MIADNEYDESRIGEDAEEPSLSGSAEISNKGMFVLLLYDKAIECMTESIQLIDEGKMIAKGEKLIQAQDIVLELSAVLDKGSGEIATNLERLYFYIYRRLIWGNVRLDIAAIREAKALMEDLYGAWHAIIVGGNTKPFTLPKTALVGNDSFGYGGLAA